MKFLKIGTITTLLLVIQYSTACSQNREDNVNFISCSAYEAITFNGHTVDEINATNGDPQAIQQLFGSYDSIKVYNQWDRKSFFYGDNMLYFDGEGTLISLKIKTNQWPVTINGNTFRVGDTVQEMKQSGFPSDLIIGSSQYLPEPYIAYNCQGNLKDGTNIHLNVEMVVTAVVYFVRI